MDHAHADAATARRHLAAHGWIARRAESFRHLPPPGAAHWLGEGEQVLDEFATLSDGWTLGAIPDADAHHVEARWFDAADAGQRAELFADLPAPGDDEAAPFAWAHRALVRQALRLRIAPSTRPVQLQLERWACHVVEAPLLVVDLLPGAHAILLETHARHDGQEVVQNLQVHVRLAQGARLQHLRHVAPAAGDRVAHQVLVRLAGGAPYEQALLAGGSAYHLQRQVLVAAASALDLQVLARHAAARTRSAVEVLAPASGAAHVVANAHTRIAAGCDDAEARQKLAGIPTGGQPRIVLRPHLEIHHDQVQAAHGATWGALPEEALFHARQRGLDERAAQALILEGLAQAVLARALDGAQPPEGFALDAPLTHAVERHLQTTEARHG